MEVVKKTNGFAGSCRAADRLMEGIARYGHFAFLLYGLVLWLAPGKTRTRRRACCLTAFLSVCLCSLASLAIGKLWKRKRPFAAEPGIWNFTSHKANSSFPSNHAMNAAAIALQLVRDRMPAAGLMAACSFVLALSRLFAGIHYPTDLLGGAGIAASVHWGLNRPIMQRLVRLGVSLLDAGEARLFGGRWR